MVRLTAIAIVMATGLTACGGGGAENAPQTDDVAEDAAQSEDAAWLIGPWVMDSEYCAGDSGITFHEDGTYTAYGETGTWELDGDRLSFVTTETAEPGEPGTAETIDNAEPIVWTISDRGTESFTQTLDGEDTALVMRRCPTVE